MQAKPASARQAFLYLNAAFIDHPNPAPRLKGSHFPHFSLVFSHLASTVVALLGILADEVAIDWSEVISKGLTLKGIYDREMYEGDGGIRDGIFCIVCGAACKTARDVTA